MAQWTVVGEAAAVPCQTSDCPGTMRIVGRRGVCPVCGKTYQREKPRHSSRLIVELTDLDVARMLAHALRCDPRDFAILGFLASGFRRSEVVGGDDNMVMLPGVHVEDVLLDQQGVRVVGKGQSPALREGRDPKRVLQPVPRVFLEAALRRGFENGPLFEDVNTHQVGDLVKEYARLAAHPEWEEVRAHRLRHWYSNAIRKRIGNQGPTALLEWQDTMRHSRSSAGSVTVAFYSGETTTFERRLEICLLAFAPVLAELQSPTFLQSLPAPLPAPQQTDTPSFRVLSNSVSFRKSSDSERETVSDNLILTVSSTDPPVQVRESEPSSAPVDLAPAVPVVEELPKLEPAAVESAVDPVQGSKVEDVVVEDPPPLEVVNEPSVPAEPPVVSKPERQPQPAPPALPTREQILKAWTSLRVKQRRDLTEEREFIKSLWKWGERKKRLQRMQCSRPGCKEDAVARDPPAVNGQPWPLFCEEHCLRDPPAGWLPV